MATSIIKWNNANASISLFMSASAIEVSTDSPEWKSTEQDALKLPPTFSLTYLTPDFVVAYFRSLKVVLIIINHFSFFYLPPNFH